MASPLPSGGLSGLQVSFHSVPQIPPTSCLLVWWLKNVKTFLFLSTILLINRNSLHFPAADKRTESLFVRACSPERVHPQWQSIWYARVVNPLISTRSFSNENISTKRTIGRQRLNANRKTGSKFNFPQRISDGLPIVRWHCNLEL